MSAPENQSQNRTRYIVFSLGDESYAIPLLSVREVIAKPEFTPIPYTPPYFLGIMNLRGQIISVMDLRAKLGIKPKETSETAVVICDLGTATLGIVVDSINAVISPGPGEISERPEIHSNRNTDFIDGVYRKEQNLVLILNVERTLSVEDRAAMNKGAPPKKAA